MLDSAPSSVDQTSYSSPFQSPIVSPSSSRGGSPKSSRRSSQTLSPKLSLKRANSYRKSSKKGLSKLDDLIKKRNLLQRDRSQSDTDINDEEREREKEERARTRRKKKSVSQDFTEKCKIRPDSTCSEKFYSVSHVGNPDRKKSLSQILDIRRLMDKSPKLSRNKTIQRAKTFSNVEDIDGDDENEGPLFQATTMFIPGYDFNTQQSVDDNSNSKNSVIRRGSKEKTFHSLLQKVHSSPNLLRRGSKDKLDKHVDQVRIKPKYSGSDSGQTKHLKNNGYTINWKREIQSEETTTKYLSISERGAIISQKQKNFRDLKKPRNAEPESPNRLVAKGNVKKISITFENGSIFKKINTNENSNENVTLSPKWYLGKHENIARNRSKGFETAEIFNNFDSDNLPINCSHGNESGYASPTDSSLSEISVPPQVNIVLHDTDYSDTYSDRWRRARDWSKEFDHKNLLTPTVKLTNLCVTEL